ncbi:MAG: pitrilysin family protein [Candidatus Babeliales bacterium]
MELFTKIKIIVLCICAIALILAHFRKKTKRPLVAPHKDAPHFEVPHDKIHKKILKNGMTVLIYTTPKIPKVLVQIAYNVGSSVEGAGQRGLAHLIEHMIFKGTNTLTEGDIDAIARKYGATYNAFTSADTTSYYFETNKDNWKPFVHILADCMQNARFDTEHLSSEIRTVVQELKMGKDNYWRMMFLKACEVAFPPNHPYHTPVIGYKDDLLTLSAKNLKHFYKSHYCPQKATLFFVGDINPEDAFALAEKHFEPITSDLQPTDPHFPKMYPELITHHVKIYEDVSKDQVMLYWAIPGLKDRSEIISSALEIILGNGQCSRLHRLLVDEKKIAASVSVSAHKFTHEGLLCIFIEPLKNKLNDCIQLVRTELSDIARQGVWPDELLRAHKYKSRTFYERLDSPAAIVSQWIKILFATGNEYEMFSRVNHYGAITPTQVQSFAKTYLDPFLMNIIQVIPLPHDKKDQRADIKKQSDAFDATIIKKYTRTSPLEAPAFVHELPAPQLINFAFPHPDKVYTLKNGLTVVLYHDNTSPLIHMDLAYKNAFDTEQTLASITADLMMHMLIEGSTAHNKNEIVSFFENLGAGYSYARDGASLVALNSDFDLATQEFCKVLTTPAFPKAVLDKLKAIYISSLQRSKDSSRYVAFELLRNTLYGQHPYQWTTDQAITSIKKITRQQLIALHKKELNPANMVLAIVGDFDPATIEKLVANTFGKLPQGHALKNNFPDPVFTPATTIDTYMLRDQAILLLGEPCPVTVHHKDFLPLKLLNAACFTSLGSRLFRLREEKGLFYTAFGGLASRSSNVPGITYTGALLSPENLEKADDMIRTMIDDIGDHGITQEELDGARQMYAKKMVDRVATNAAIAGTLCYLASMHLPYDYYDATLKRLKTLPLEQVNSIASKHLGSADMARIRVGRIQRHALGKAVG